MRLMKRRAASKASALVSVAARMCSYVHPSKPGAAPRLSDLRALRNCSSVTCTGPVVVSGATGGSAAGCRARNSSMTSAVGSGIGSCSSFLAALRTLPS